MGRHDDALESNWARFIELRPTILLRSPVDHDYRYERPC